MHNGYRATLHAAIALALGGFKCFPVRLVGNKKIPTTPRGFKDASADPFILRQLWQRYPGPLIGVCTGAASGIDVLDIDQHLEARAWLQQNRSRLPATRVHRSRSGGLHFVFQHSPGLRCSNGRLARGVEVKADRGTITWWPAAGLPVLHNGDPMPWPPWLLTLLQSPPPRPKADCCRKQSASSPQQTENRFLAIVDRVASAPEGERNRITFWAGCRVAELAAEGGLQESTAAALIIEAAIAAGLPRLEAVGAVRSGLRTGSR
jgi:hypothetical protein